MKIVFFKKHNRGNLPDTVSITAQGNIRIGKLCAEVFNIKKGDYFKVGYVFGTATGAPRYLYIVRHTGNPNVNSYKVGDAAGTLHIDCQAIAKTFNIERTINCKLENWKDEEMEGFKMLIPEQKISTSNSNKNSNT